MLNPWPLSLVPTKVKMIGIVVYSIIEIVFYGHYRLHILPKVNERREPEEYYDYGKDRTKLALRIIRHLVRRCEMKKLSINEEVQKLYGAFIYQEGVRTVPPPGEMEATFLKDGDVPYPGKRDVDDMMAWAFFSKYFEELEAWETKEVQRIYQTMEDKFNIRFEPGRTANESDPNRPKLQTTRPTLEPIRCLHRMLIVYLFFGAIRYFVNFLMLCAGFRRFVHEKTGLSYWYRPQLANSTSKTALPLVLFHGVAPGGLALYFMFILRCAGRDGRPLIVVENPPISLMWSFHAIDEKNTVAGLLDAMDKHFGPDSKVSVLGHSFGTCQVTWLLRRASHRIKQVTLVDPAAILLSEPHIVKNFLYERPLMQRAIISKHSVIGYEVGICYFLQRNFFWYNSQLFLDEMIPPHVSTVVCLSGKDEILNAPRVTEEVKACRELLLSKGLPPSHFDIVIWPDVGHGKCVSRRKYWADISEAIVKQEEIIYQQEKLGIATKTTT